MKEDRISVARFMAACLSAAVAAPLPLAFVMLVADPDLMVFFSGLTLIVGFVVALAHVLLVALPAYALLSRWWRLTWWNSAVAGMLVGGVPSVVLTMDWWPLVFPGLCGIVGGLAFWVVIQGGLDRNPPTGRNGLNGIFA